MEHRHLPPCDGSGDVILELPDDLIQAAGLAVGYTTKLGPTQPATEPCMRPDPDTVAAVYRFLRLITDRYEIAGALLYGSRARGTHRPDSDADMAVILRGEPQRVLPTALEMSDVAYDVLLETGIRISPLPVWLDEWTHPEAHRNPALLRNIAAEGIPVQIEQGSGDKP